MSTIKHQIQSYILLTLALILSALACIFIGSVDINLEEIWLADSFSHSIVFDIRLPRMLAAVFVGGALSVSGYCLQSFFHNPIAGPYLLGISSGAKLSVALVLIVFAGNITVLSNLSMIGASFLGAMIAMGFVLIISRKVSSMAMLLVCGVMIGYICTAICDFVVTFASESDIVNLHNWSRGSLSGIGIKQAMIMAAVVSVSSIAIFLLSKPLSAFLVSESFAKSVGVNIKLFKLILVLFSSLLASVVTAFAGPVSFVGIAVPHLIRGMLKTASPKCIIPACFLGGAVFTCICDLIARTIFSPTELSISTVTAIFGAPVVIYMMIRKNK